MDIHIYHHFEKNCDETDILHRILHGIGEIKQGQQIIMDNTVKTQQAIDDLAATVTAETTVIESAVTLIGGFAQRLADAIAAASNAGATDAQLASLTDLNTAVTTEKQKLADAVAANTPAA